MFPLPSYTPHNYAQVNNGNDIKFSVVLKLESTILGIGNAYVQQMYKD